MSDSEKLAKIFEQQRLSREKFILEWNEENSPLHEVHIERDEVGVVVGIWRADDGRVFTIEKLVGKNVYDPCMGRYLEPEVVDAIVKVVNANLS